MRKTHRRCRADGGDVLEGGISSRLKSLEKSGLLPKRVGNLMSRFQDQLGEKPVRGIGIKKIEIFGGEPKRKSGGRLWIQDAVKNKGALHRSLKVPQGKKIPLAKIEKAEHSKNPTLRKRARLAETLRKFHK